MEEVTAELAATGDVLKPNLHQHLYFELEEIKEILDEIWEEQMVLYATLHPYFTTDTPEFYLAS